MSINLALYCDSEPASPRPFHTQCKQEVSIFASHRIFYYSVMHSKPKDTLHHIALPDTVLSHRSVFPSKSLDSSPNPSDTTIRPPSKSLRHTITQKDRRGYLSNDLQRVPQVPCMMDNDLRQGDAKRLISWSDDDVDGTDFKNMPDYDSDQDESDYSSTPEPDDLSYGFDKADESSI